MIDVSVNSGDSTWQEASIISYLYTIETDTSFLAKSNTPNGCKLGETVTAPTFSPTSCST